MFGLGCLVVATHVDTLIAGVVPVGCVARSHRAARMADHTAGSSPPSRHSTMPVTPYRFASSNTALLQLVRLPGGGLATVQTGGDVWSSPDLHGNVTVTANNTGDRLNGPVTCDPGGSRPRAVRRSTTLPVATSSVPW
jgi:hypothetical protein